jgi:ABC-type multidrug transport system fused ATPase/permease subunit
MNRHRPGVPGESKKVTLKTVRNAFKNIIWPRKKLLFMGLFLTVINRMAGLVLPGSTKYLIDDVIAKRDVSLLAVIVAAVGGALLVQSVSSFLLTRLLSVEAQHLISRLRVQVHEHLVRLPIKFFDDNQSGALVSRVMNDVEGVRNLVGTGFVLMVGGVLTASASLVILIKINAQLTLIAVVPLILFGLVSLKAFSYIRPIFRERWAINADVTGRLTEAIGGIRVIRGFNAEAQEERVFEQGVDRLFQNVRRSLTATALVSSVAIFLMGVASISIMWVGGRMILGGSMTVGDFFAYTLYLAFLVAPIIQMSNIGSQLTEAFAGLDRMELILSREQEGREPRRTVELGDIKGDVSFENVSFSYKDGKEVIRDVSFTAPAGTVTAFVGSSGAGKTTLAQLAASFITPDSGVIRIDGIDLSTVRLDSYRSRLGVVLQDDFLFDGSIRENILFACPGSCDDELKDAVQAAHVREFVDRFDEGLDTIIGERGVKLSGGQRQRVAIARALLANPRILILDEATSNLDTESEIYIQQSLANLLQNRTTFVIAHRLSTIRRADQILVIEDGRIVERGTHDDLIAREGRYHQLYTYQARI